MIREHKAKANKEAEVEQGRGFKSLKQKEEHLREQVELQRKREECRKRVADLTLELLMTSYEKRSKHFSDKTKLFRLTETIMQVRNPYLWKRFLDFYEHYSDSVIAVFTAIGGQENFEQQLAEGAPGQRLDSYIQTRLEESLEAWTRTPEEEEDEQENSETSKPRLSQTQWIDEEGDFHIQIPLDNEENDEDY